MHNLLANNEAFKVILELYKYVIVGGSRPKLLEPFKDLTVSSPKEAVFECRIDLGEPTAKLRCFRDNKELFTGTKYMTIIRDDEIRLVIRDTEISDTANYRLEASNKLGSVDTEAKLNVNGQLIFSHMNLVYNNFGRS